MSSKDRVRPGRLCGRNAKSLREHLRYSWIILAIALLFSLPAIVGVDVDEDVEERVPQAKDVTPEQLRSGGSLRLATPGSLETFDPHQATSAPELLIAGSVTDGLVSYTSSDGVRGAAAESWQFSEDGMNLEITLRRGLQFSDGTSCDAEAAAASLRRAREVGPSVVAGAWLASVREIRVVDELTLELELWYPDPNLTFNLSRPGMGLVSPTAVEEMDEEFQFAPVGLGPYEFAWEEGLKRIDIFGGSINNDEGDTQGQAIDTVSVGLTADPNYYGGSPSLDSLIVTNFPPDTDPQDLVRMNVGLITEVPLGYEPPEDWSVLKRPNLDHHILMYNLASPVLSDERARRAISAAVDKESIVDRVFSGDAELLAPCEVPTTGERREVQDEEGNVERGRSLLADAGFLAPEAGGNAESESDVELLMISDDHPERVKVSQLIAEHIELLGISVRLEVLDRPEYYERMRSGDYDLSYWVLVPELVDPLAYTANFRSDSYWNVSQIWDNPEMRDLQEEIDEILVDVAGVYDGEERTELLADFAELITENHLYTSLWNTSVRGLIRNDVSGVRVPYGNDFHLDRARTTNGGDRGS